VMVFGFSSRPQWFINVMVFGFPSRPQWFICDGLWFSVKTTMVH
jgi:hypothetical protein